MSAEFNQFLSLPDAVRPDSVWGEQCTFCTIPETKTTEVFSDMHGDVPHTLDVPGVPDTFTVLQDVVPIAESGGHVLLMPNLHRISLATVEDQAGIDTATEKIIVPIQEAFPANPILVFEHGPGFIEDKPIACGGCHMDHAHGHLLLLPEGQKLEPIQHNMEQVLSKNGWDNLEAQRRSSDQVFTGISETAGMSPYLQVGMINADNSRQSLTYVQKREAQQVPSQLLRKVVSEVVYQRPEPSYWHWRDIAEIGMATPERATQIKSDVRTFRARTNF